MTEVPSLLSVPYPYPEEEELDKEEGEDEDDEDVVAPNPCDENKNLEASPRTMEQSEEGSVSDMVALVMTIDIPNGCGAEEEADEEEVLEEGTPEYTPSAPKES